VADKIRNGDQYRATFSGTPMEKDKTVEAPKNALDIRKFEIELYWKRTGYFGTLCNRGLLTMLTYLVLFSLTCWRPPRWTPPAVYLPLPGKSHTPLSVSRQAPT
jgi:hypothetical protein